MDSNWHLRNRGRDSIVSMLKVVRDIQLICGFKSSDVITILANVYRDTEESNTSLTLLYAAREIQREERRQR